MNFENFPTSENIKPQEKPGQTNWRNYVIASLIVVLLATWAYIIWEKSKTKETLLQKELVITNTVSERDLLKQQLEEASSLYDRIKTNSAHMEHIKDSTINRRDREILEKKNKIQQLLSKVGATQQELAEAKMLINSLNDDIVVYKKQVETLQQEKTILQQEKNIVIQQRDRVQKNYDSATTLIQQKEQVIDVASTLKANNFSILGIREKNNGKEEKTSTAKKVDKLRISFDIEENRVAKSGTKQIYICITGPDGKLIAMENMGSGKFTTRNGEVKMYTQKIELNYIQGQRQTLSFDWKQNTNFVTGEYKIEVYNNGFKIGEGISTLKKGWLFG